MLSYLWDLLRQPWQMLFCRSRWLICVGLLFAVAAPFFALRMTPDRLAESQTALDVELVGRDYCFYFRYPGEDHQLLTQDDRYGSRDFYVLADTVVRMRLNSLDYIYLLEIPQVGIYEVAAPELVFDVQFVASHKGQHELLGSQMCGYDHPELLGKLIVQSPTEFRRTMNRLSQIPLQTQQ